jgi:hypothetical protein
MADDHPAIGKRLFMLGNGLVVAHVFSIFVTCWLALIYGSWREFLSEMIDLPLLVHWLLPLLVFFSSPPPTSFVKFETGDVSP